MWLNDKVIPRSPVLTQSGPFRSRGAAQTMAGEALMLLMQLVRVPVAILLMYKAHRISYLVKWERNDSYSVYMKRQLIITCIFFICVRPRTQGRQVCRLSSNAF